MGTKKKPGWFELSAGCTFQALIYSMKKLRSICNDAKNYSMPKFWPDSKLLVLI
jgi:hypothetical protein